MLQVQHMQPLLTARSNTTLRLVFAYKHLIIRKYDELFHFVPIEAQEIIINLRDMHIENCTDIFVFRGGTQTLRLPLFQLMLIPNIQQYLNIIIQKSNITPKHHQPININELMEEIEAANTNHLIDHALDTRNKTLFHQLLDKTM